MSPGTLRLRRNCLIGVCWLWGCVGSVVWAADQENTLLSEPAPREVRWAVGGCGGAYFLASPGPLVIDVYKRDLHRRNILTELRAILAGPDRQVLQEIRLPDDGRPTGSGPGPWQWGRLSTHVPRKGIYVLNITVSNDRYGDEIAWGFQTNCPQYLIEIARGHRDQPHQEPIVLLCPEQPGQVCFHPRLGELALEITGLPQEVSSLEVRDAKDRVVAKVSVEAGCAEHRFSAAQTREATPWRILFPKQQGTLQVDGLTRWEPDDPAPNIACWTPDPKSWFSWLENRWLLMPYRRVVYGEPGQQGTLPFRVHNNARHRRSVNLFLEFPGPQWPIRLSQTTVEVPPRQAVEVLVEYTVPSDGQPRQCVLRAPPQDDPAFSTYSTIRVVPGPAPCKKPLSIPLVLKPYEHENEQLGYLPAYPLESQLYFDMENQPWVVSGPRVATWQPGGWQWRPLSEAVTRRVPDFPGRSFSSATTKVAFDRENHVYVLARSGAHTALLHSSDRGKTFTAYLLPPSAQGVPGGGSSTFDLEEFTGHNILDGPPPILRYTLIGRDPKHFWRWIHHLELIVGEKKEGVLRFQPPVLVSRQCIGLAAHSGIPSSLVSHGDRVHLVWGEATDPAEKVPGVPTYAATYDRTTRQLSKPVLIGYGPPPNDVHNSPSITIDSKGYLHVLCGTHGRPFPYARSLQPHDASAGWTEARVLGENLEQTYIGLVCGKDDSLYTAYRLWQRQKPPHPLATHATLAFQRKPADGPWQEPQILVSPPFSEYSVYYHRLTIDRHGRIFLSYDYWSTHWFYRNDHLGTRRAVLFSPDRGASWKLLDQEDLLRP